MAINLTLPLHSVSDEDLEVAQKRVADPSITHLEMWMFQNVVRAIAWSEQQRREGLNPDVAYLRLMQHSRNMVEQLKLAVEQAEEDSEFVPIFGAN